MSSKSLAAVLPAFSTPDRTLDQKPGDDVLDELN
jgi:hypothetical protein